MEILADLINARLSHLGISRTELTQRLGFANQSKGLRRFDEFMDTGRRSSHLLKALPEVLGLNTAQVEAAAAATRQQIADAVEAAARERFRPHILVLTNGGVRMPFFVQAFAWGGKVLGLPDEFVDLSLARQVRQAAKIVRRHFGENGGKLNASGDITGYRLQRTFDHAVVLNTDGTIREGFNRDPEPPPPELQVKGKRVPVRAFVGDDTMFRSPVESLLTILQV